MAERVVLHPAWREPDPGDPELERLFGSVPEAGGRVMRVVVCFEAEDRCRIVTVFLDPDADAAHARPCEGRIESSSEVAPGIIVDWSEDDRPLGLEVLNVRGRVGRSDPVSFVAGLVEGLVVTRLDRAEAAE